MSNEKKRKYMAVDDLPKCGCGQGKLSIDEDRLDDYSDLILGIVVVEIDKQLAMPLWALGFSCPASDVDGRKAWLANEERGRAYMRDVKRKVEKELARRQDE